jgi:DMSO/TMAO reductase YedYZ molybdopterin-dependent catalytic subunit
LSVPGAQTTARPKPQNKEIAPPSRGQASDTPQRLLGGNQTLAREDSEAELSPQFRANGTLDPDDDDYQELASKQFVDWRLEVTGLVDRPLRLSLDELRAMPSRMQITRHDCVEGWSCIGQVERCRPGRCAAAGRAAAGRAIRVFRCADPIQIANSTRASA